MERTDSDEPPSLFDRYSKSAGPDDDFCREHLALLIATGSFKEVFPDHLHREVIARYLGVLSVSRDNQLVVGRPYGVREIVASLMAQYRVPHGAAYDLVADTYGRFIETIPTPSDG